MSSYYPLLITRFLFGAGEAGAFPNASIAVSRLIESMLFGVQPGDVLTFAGMLGILTFVAALAGYLPARRASRIDPIVALHYE